jgi:predicted ATPase/class 3 adenylate cyclase/Tfp pilus assembly protein PilF
MTDLPSGTVTFLFTDIEGSTALWERDRAAMRAAVDRQLAILHSLISAHHGVLFKTIGDGTQAAFGTAEDALRAALASQRALLAEDWGELGPIRVRMALHAGEAQPDAQGDYLAAPLNRLARLLATGSGGQVLLSQTVQQLTRGALPAGTTLQDLGEHRLRDLLEPEHVFQLLHPDLPADFPPLESLENRPNNLPLQPTPFLGREHEVQQIVDLLRRPEVRFLTLTGPGGTGKTRLALQAAADLLDDFADGVYFVPLASLADPDLVLATIATTLGMREEGDQPLVARFRDFLATKQLLLVLDNMEHLANAAPAVGELLSTSPGLKVLATSRMPLRLRAEREYAVPPLGLPRRKPPPTAEQLSQYEAVRLFIERAQAVKADFTIDNASAPAVAEICHRLDGLPLAIELAAARVRMLPPQAMLARLEQRLPMLTSGARDAPERQRTLRNTIAWSYDLLEPEEQEVFCQLAVFTGGLSLDAADAVANPEGQLDIFGSLESLVEQSLIRQEAGTAIEPRFNMLETIREFGLEQLNATGEADEARARHAVFFLALAEEAAPALKGPQQLAWLERLETEHDNMRSALGWALTREPETALGLVAALYWFWFYRGHLTEGRDWTERALATGMSAKPELRARALNNSSAFARKQADAVTALSRAEQALALARSVGDKWSEGWALINLGTLTGILGDPKRAGTLFSEAEAQFFSIGERWGAAAAIYSQGLAVGSMGDIDRQRALFERSLAESRALGDRIQASWALISLGKHELERGDLARARTLLEEALATARDFRFVLTEAEALRGLAGVTGEIGEADLTTTLLRESEEKYRELGHPVYLADALNSFGYLALRNGNHERARRLFEEAVQILRDLGASGAVAGFLQSLSDAYRASGDYKGAAVRCREGLVLAQETENTRAVAACINGLAGLAVEIGRNEEAARLFGAVDTMRKTVGPLRSRYEDERQSRDMAVVRDALGAEAELEARSAGQALPLEQAVREALALADDIVRDSARSPLLHSAGETS